MRWRYILPSLIMGAKKIEIATFAAKIDHILKSHNRPKTISYIRRYIRLLLDDALLNVHQHSTGLKQSRSCECGLGIDNVEHFLLQCTLHDDLRHDDRGGLNLSVQLLLFPFAIDQLTYVDCHEVLSATFSYIKNSHRQL